MCGWKKPKLYRLYETGEDKIASDFDFGKIMRAVRNNRLLIRKFLVTAE